MKRVLALAFLFGLVAHAAPVPTVAFTGDAFVAAWQASGTFPANWTGAGIGNAPIYQFSSTAAADFNAVVATRPAFVFIDTGATDLTDGQTFEDTAGHDWSTASAAITQIVTEAQAAGVKVILGTVPLSGYDSDLLNDWIAQYGVSHGVPVVNLQYWLAHGCAGVQVSQTPCLLANVDQYGAFDPTPAGYAFITSLVQSAISTYGLTMRGGYLSDVQLVNNPIDGQPAAPLAAQVNQECTGGAIQFMPWANWSDGVSRPMLNAPYDGGILGTWRSSNPTVLGVNQHGVAYAYAPGTATVTFTPTGGKMFSPWVVKVFSAYPGGS
jgi:hypothetical protein